jgi:hypothetical protein
MKILISLKNDGDETIIGYYVEVNSERDLATVFEAVRAESRRKGVFPIMTGNLVVHCHVGLKEAADVVRAVAPIRVTEDEVTRLNDRFREGRFAVTASLKTELPDENADGPATLPSRT